MGNAGKRADGLAGERANGQAGKVYRPTRLLRCARNDGGSWFYMRTDEQVGKAYHPARLLRCARNDEGGVSWFYGFTTGMRAVYGGCSALRCRVGEGAS